jgi:ATP-dependent Lon protease
MAGSRPLAPRTVDVEEKPMDNERRPSRRPRRTLEALLDDQMMPSAQVSSAPPGEGREPVRELPVLPIRNTVIFPNALVPLFVDRESAVRAVEEAMAQDRTIVAVTQRSAELDEATQDDLFTIGTECSIARLLRMPDGTHNVLVQGQRRMRVVRWARHAKFLAARVTAHDEPEASGAVIQALTRTALGLLERCTKLSARLTDETYVQALNLERPGALADFIAAQVEPGVPARQAILEALDPAERLRRVCRMLTAEMQVLELEHQIQDEVQREVDRNQREFYLREQLKIIQRELGEHDPSLREISDLRLRIYSCGMPEEVAQRALKEAERLEGMPSIAPEYSVLRTYLDWLVSVPWQEHTEDNLDLRRVAEVLEANHYGLARVKDRIIEYIAVRRLAPEGRTPILCLAGPPGVGKTSLGRSIAQALGRKFVRVSLGGVRDEAEIRGHRRTYVGALPGRIIQTMKTAATVNPVFVLDEIDKLAADFRGDPAAALLEVLDPEQNHAFSDHYLEVPYDLSKVFFVLTANVVSAIPSALRDRMEVIEIASYIEEEKLHIAQQFLVPRQRRDSGLSEARVEIEEAALRRVIREYTFEAGVRNLEREVGGIMRKVARRVVEGRRNKVVVTEARVPTYLGPQKVFPTEAEERDTVGVATGLAWTAAGGDLTTVEVMAVPGRGALTLTGQLGDVMKESAQAALTYARARADILGLPEDFHERQDVHIHLPGGGIPKDGPSAGITMAVAIISALSGRPVRRDVAMTGEITLRGRVLAVGGIKEKVLAAHRANLSTVIVPRRNLKDLDEVPAAVREALRLVPVESMDEVMEIALPARRPASAGSGREDSSSGVATPRIPHPPLTIADPLPATGRVARPRPRRPVVIAP